MKKSTTHNLTVAAMLSAVAFILMFIEFPIPMLIPSFVKMDFSDLPALLGAFALGPVYGVVISFMKNLLHIVIKGTSTACVGELCNFMLGAVFSAVAGVIYKHHKSRKTAIIGAIAGAAAMAVFSVPSNYFITYPAYVQSTTCRWKPSSACIRPSCLLQTASSSALSSSICPSRWSKACWMQCCAC